MFDTQAAAVRRVPVKGAPGEDVHHRLEAAFATFREREAAPERTVEGDSQGAVELSIEVYRINPFLDGNTRMTLIIPQAGTPPARPRAGHGACPRLGVGRRAVVGASAR